MHKGYVHVKKNYLCACKKKSIDMHITRTHTHTHAHILVLIHTHTPYTQTHTLTGNATLAPTQINPRKFASTRTRIHS